MRAQTGRYPCTTVLLLSGLALALGAAGIPPEVLWRFLLVPAYVLHLLIGQAIGPHYWLLVATTLALALLLDGLVRRAA